MFSNHSRISGGTFLNCPRSIAAAVVLTAQHMSAAIRSECLRNMNFQTVIAMRCDLAIFKSTIGVN
jgi:hypothetical protein